jgi:large subunit ribosomal protein L25
VHISSVKLPEGCKPIIADRDFTVVTIAPPAKVEEAPAAAAPAAGGKAPAKAPAKAAPKK